MPRTFLARAQETSGKVVEEYSHTSSSTKIITTFFIPIYPTNDTSQARDTQMGSQPGHNKRVTTNQAIAICHAHKPRPKPHEPQPQHPCHRQIKAIISCHRRCFPHFEDLSILDRPMPEIFRRQKL